MVLPRPDTIAGGLDICGVLAESADAGMIIPLTMFHAMPERRNCRGSFETGAVLAAHDNKARYVRSIVEIVNARGNLVGWVYLADRHGNDEAEYVQGTAHMSKSDLAGLHLRLLANNAVSSISLLTAHLPMDLRAKPCFDIEPTQ